MLVAGNVKNEELKSSALMVDLMFSSYQSDCTILGLASVQSLGTNTFRVPFSF